MAVRETPHKPQDRWRSAMSAPGHWPDLMTQAWAGHNESETYEPKLDT